MDKNLHDNIDEIFRDPLQSFEERPARKVWENIERELDRDKRETFLFLFRDRALQLGTACLIFLCITLGIVLNPGEKSKPVRELKQPAVSSSLFPSLGSKARIHIDEAAAAALPAPVSALPAMISASPASARYIQPVGLEPLQPEPSAGGILALAPPVPVNQINTMKKQPRVYLADRPHRWSLTGYFAQELAGYNLADHDSTAANGREIDKKASSIFSESGGLLAGYRLSKKWLIQSGLIYSWSRSISGPSVAYAVTDNNGNTKYRLNTPTGYGFLPASSSVSDSVSTNQPSSRLHYLSVPVIVSYVFTAKRFSFLTGAGAIGNFLTSASVASKIQGPSSPQSESIVTLYGLRKVNYGLFFKAEIQYAIRADWSVNLTLTSKNALTPINTNSSFSTYPYYIGLGLGLRYSF
jgi:hypothetical protein